MSGGTLKVFNVANGKEYSAKATTIRNGVVVIRFANGGTSRTVAAVEYTMEEWTALVDFVTKANTTGTVKVVVPRDFTQHGTLYSPPTSDDKFQARDNNPLWCRKCGQFIGNHVDLNCPKFVSPVVFR